MNSFHQTRKGTENYQEDMKNLQYDMLYGKQYVWNQENPFKATDLTFGIRDLEVTKAYETDDSVFIVGNNFTNYAEVYVDDVQINTTYHNEHLLEVPKILWKTEIHLQSALSARRLECFGHQNRMYIKKNNGN